MSSGSVRSAQSRSTSYGDDLGDDVPDAVQLRVPEQRIGVRLERALAHDGAVSLVLEVATRPCRVDEPAERGDVRLLHRQDHVVVERLADALDQQVVRRQPGGADAEPGLADHVAQVVEEVAVRPLRARDRLEVGLVGRLDPLGSRLPRRRVEASSRSTRVPSARTVDSVQELGPARDGPRPARRARGPRCCRGAGRSRRSSVPRTRRPGPGRRAGGCPSRSRTSASAAPSASRATPATREALQVPGEVPEVGLVEVVDVEDEAAVGVEVGPEVLDVQVAVDPDPAAVLVGERVVRTGDVGEEDARRAAVERMRVSGHRSGTCRGTTPDRRPSAARTPSESVSTMRSVRSASET